MRYTRNPRAARRRRNRHLISRILFASLMTGAALLSVHTIQGVGEDVASLGSAAEEPVYVND